MPLTCPNPNPPAMTLTQFISRIKSDPTFLADFKSTLDSAGANDKAARDCIESYLKPTEQELEGFGVPNANVLPARFCTESGKLALILATR